MEDLQLQHVFQCFQLLRAVLFVFMWEQPTHPLLGPFQHEHGAYLPLNTLSLGCSQEVTAARRQQGWSSLIELP